MTKKVGVILPRSPTSGIIFLFACSNELQWPSYKSKDHALILEKQKIPLLWPFFFIMPNFSPPLSILYPINYFQFLFLQKKKSRQEIESESHSI